MKSFVIGLLCCASLLLPQVNSVNAQSYDIDHISIRNVTYTGASIRNTPKVYNAQGKRVSSRYFSVIYDGNTVDAGEVLVIVKGRGKYQGTAYGSYRIKPRSIKQCKITGIRSYGYTGKFKYQNVNVSYKGRDVSYRLVYDYSTDVGRHRLKIKGLGNFKGTVTRSYRIY
jgi:hypothetical protein